MQNSVFRLTTDVVINRTRRGVDEENYNKVLHVVIQTE